MDLQDEVASSRSGGVVAADITTYRMVRTKLLQTARRVRTEEVPNIDDLRDPQGNPEDRNEDVADRERGSAVGLKETGKRLVAVRSAPWKLTQTVPGTLEV